jgi:hypothetical protein
VEWKARIINLVVTGIIISAVWLTVFSVRENNSFSIATKQILDIVVNTKEFLGRDAGLPVGMDILKNLERTQRLSGVADSKEGGVILNAWGGGVHAFMVTPLLLRVQTEVSSTSCRQMSNLFINEIREVTVSGVDVRSDQAGSVRQILEERKGDGQKISWDSIVSGCGNSSPVLLGITFSLR